MCGRYAFTADPQTATSRYGLVEVPTFLTPRYNIAPLQLVPVVAARADGVPRRMGQLAWGLLPSWANDAETYRPINARSETVHDFGMFAMPFRHRRCLLPVSGFYEWQPPSKKLKQPHYFTTRDRRPFAFAGIWDSWSDGTTRILSCCSLTTTPNELVAPVHDRMPVIVHPDDYTDWLAEATPLARLKELLRPYPAELMEAWPVSSYVSKATNEGPGCVEPLAAEVSA